MGIRFSFGISFPFSMVIALWVTQNMMLLCRRYSRGHRRSHDLTTSHIYIQCTPCSLSCGPPLCPFHAPSTSPRSPRVSSMALFSIPCPHLVKFHHAKFEKKIGDYHLFQWELGSGGSKGGAPARPFPSPWPKIYSISCSFYEILPKSDVGTPSYGESLIFPCLVIFVV